VVQVEEEMMGKVPMTMAEMEVVIPAEAEAVVVLAHPLAGQVVQES
jgi:hypothetical protein